VNQAKFIQAKFCKAKIILQSRSPALARDRRGVISAANSAPPSAFFDRRTFRGLCLLSFVEMEFRAAISSIKVIRDRAYSTSRPCSNVGN
jgi:hypothetical protein